MGTTAYGNAMAGIQEGTQAGLQENSNPYRGVKIKWFSGVPQISYGTP